MADGRERARGGHDRGGRREAPPQRLEDLEIPRDLEREAALLGSVLRNPSVLPEVTRLIRTPESFHDEGHRALFRAILELDVEGVAIDTMTVVQRLREMDMLTVAGGTSRIATLPHSVPTSVHALDHAQVVRRYALQRSLQEVGIDTALEASREAASPEELLNQMQERLHRLAEDGAQRDVVSLEVAIGAALARFDTVVRDRKAGRIGGVPSGYHRLDEITGGWQRSELIILAARPAMGKTAFALNLLMNAARDHRNGPFPGVFFSLEMSREQLATRLWASDAQIQSTQIRDGLVPTRDYDRLYAAIERLKQLPVFIDDTPAITVAEIIRKCRQLQATHGIRIVLIDYLQLIGAGAGLKNANREQVISEISRGLKMLAKELDVPVIALSQLNRSVESRADKRPMLSDLRESGAIEQDADIISFLYRQDYYDRKDDEAAGKAAPVREEEDTGPSITEVIIAKNRSGETDTVKLLFDKASSLFVNLPGAVPPPQDKDKPSYVRDERGDYPIPAPDPDGTSPTDTLHGDPIPPPDDPGSALPPAFDDLGLDEDDIPI